MSKLLINEPPLQVLPSLARAVGLNEAIVLQQLHYWMAHAKTQHEGRKWVYKTVQEWKNEFSFWSVSTIERVFKSLESKGLVHSATLSKDAWDRTKYYSIDYTNLATFTAEFAQVIDSSHSVNLTECIPSTCQNPIRQSDGLQSVKLTDSSIPENTTETTTEKKAPTAKKATRATSLPDDFAISEQVRQWAEKQGFAPWLDLHLEHFRDYALSKGKTYTDWDAAFRNAVRDDWGDVRKRTPSPTPAPVAAPKPRTDIVSPERRAERVAMLRAAMIGRGVH